MIYVLWSHRISATIGPASFGTQSGGYKVPQARLGEVEQHHITGPGKLLSRELLQQFVCSYTQMSYGHTKGGEAGNARHESCSVRSYHQDRLTLVEVKAPTNAHLRKKESDNCLREIVENFKAPNWVRKWVLAKHDYFWE